MWAFRRLATSSARVAAAGSGSLLGSVLLVNEDKPSWRVEYPSHADNVAFKHSRRIINEQDKTGLNLTLYQYQTCPYCCKVRAVLDYYGLSYTVVEVNPVTRSQIKFSKDYKKVPIVVSPTVDQPLKESSLIISLLSTFLHRSDRTLDECKDFYPILESVDPATGKPQVSYPNKFYIMQEDSKQSTEQLQNAREEREWRQWVDEHFIHLISPNVYRTWSESLATFQYFDAVGDWKRNFPTWERYLAVYLGALIMFGVSKRLKKRHAIDDERQALRDACNQWLAAVGPSRRFLGGAEPNLADLALYGAINSFVGCSAFEEMRRETKIGEWYDAVHQRVIHRDGRALVAAKSEAIAQKASV